MVGILIFFMSVAGIIGIFSLINISLVKRESYAAEEHFQFISDQTMERSAS